MVKYRWGIDLHPLVFVAIGIVLFVLVVIGLALAVHP